MIPTLKLSPVFLAVVMMLSTAIGCQRRVEEKPIPPAVEMTTASGVEVVLVPSGSFVMGSDEGRDDESPPHNVRLAPFAIDKYEVTQDQFAKFELPDPSHFKNARRPVEQIRWNEAALFCNERSLAENLTPCYDEETFECDFEATGYRLPTEAEWEYAARAGASGLFSCGDLNADLAAYAVYKESVAGRMTEIVGQKKANHWGLHDMHGNVAEWCHDKYSADYYGESPGENPHGPTSGKRRLLRGGAWKSSADECRLAARKGAIAGLSDACFTGDHLGFRCVRRLSDDEIRQLETAASEAE